MKTMFSILMILGFGLTTNAATQLKELTCYSRAEFKDARQIKFKDLSPKDSLVEPSVIGLDGSVSEWFIRNKKVYIYFSNECDNSFAFQFSTIDLENLASGKANKVHGRMSYSQATGDVNDENVPVIIGEDHVGLTCYKTR